jgi:hypothetical protein
MTLYPLGQRSPGLMATWAANGDAHKLKNCPNYGLFLQATGDVSAQKASEERMFLLKLDRTADGIPWLVELV